MRYTPRNDGNQNGMVKDYELYVSDSKTDFGSAIKTGTFGGGTTPTSVDFPATRALRPLSRAQLDQRQPYTAVAELDFAGTPM